MGGAMEHSCDLSIQKVRGGGSESSRIAWAINKNQFLKSKRARVIQW